MDPIVHGESFALSEIPGLSDLLERSKEIVTATREDAWLGSTRVIAGKRVRPMSVDDFTILLQFESPLLTRQVPTPDELSFFLWVLSPEIERWHDRKGWRKPWLGRFERLESYLHSRHVRRTLKLGELERMEDEWLRKHKVPFTLPEDCSFSIAIKQAFEYVDDMFLDKPPSLESKGVESGLCYLTSWFDWMQSEYHMPTKEVWKMTLPVLFARLKAIQKRHRAKVPEFNTDRDKILQNIMAGLRQGFYTVADLRAGRVDLENNKLRQN